jgi:hypothetical protein
MNPIDQINAMSEEHRERFIWFLNVLFNEHVIIEMFGDEENCYYHEGKYYYHEINFDFDSSLNEMVCNMNNVIANYDVADSLSKFFDKVCNNLSQYQEFIDLLNQCDVDKLKPYINYDDSIAKFEHMRKTLLRNYND